MQNPANRATPSEVHRADQLIGTVIAGRYQVAALLGVGSMGAVYLVNHVAIRKRMALKVLHPSMLGVPEVVARFEREAMAAAYVDHPNVAAAYDYGRTEDGGFFLVLEYVDGQELSSVLKKGPLTVARTLHIARQIASLLCLTHQLNIVHRDLKPDNIMLTGRDGQQDFVKVLDFGLAKVPGDLRMQVGSATGSAGLPDQQLTKIGALYGTPGYMAPEQALSAAIDSRCDLYSLGSILYEMLTGRPPFDGNTVLELIDSHLTLPLPPMRQRAPSVFVPAPVEDLVRRLLAKRPEDRFRDPQALLAALDQLAGTGKPELPGPAAAPPSREVPTVGKASAQTPGPGPESAAPALPRVARQGTIVGLQLDPPSPWAQLVQLQRTLPPAAKKLLLGLLLGTLAAGSALAVLIQTLLRSAH